MTVAEPAWNPAWSYVPAGAFIGWSALMFFFLLKPEYLAHLYSYRQNYSNRALLIARIAAALWAVGGASVALRYVELVPSQDAAKVALVAAGSTFFWAGSAFISRQNRLRRDRDQARRADRQ